MAALLFEICKEVQLSDVERAFIMYLVGAWFIVTPLCFLLALLRHSGRKKGDKDGTEV